MTWTRVLRSQTIPIPSIAALPGKHDRNSATAPENDHSRFADLDGMIPAPTPSGQQEVRLIRDPRDKEARRRAMMRQSGERRRCRLRMADPVGSLRRRPAANINGEQVGDAQDPQNAKQSSGSKPTDRPSSGWADPTTIVRFDPRRRKAATAIRKTPAIRRRAILITERQNIDGQKQSSTENQRAVTRLSHDQ